MWIVGLGMMALMFFGGMMGGDGLFMHKQEGRSDAHQHLTEADRSHHHGIQAPTETSEDMKRASIEENGIDKKQLPDAGDTDCVQKNSCP